MMVLLIFFTPQLTLATLRIKDTHVVPYSEYLGMLYNCLTVNNRVLFVIHSLDLGLATLNRKIIFLIQIVGFC